MKQRPAYWLFYLAGTVVAVITTFFQHSPGYMDAAYYTVTGAQIAQGKGMVEPFLWNYLDNPTGLPHAAFTYWMPFPALLASLGFFLSQSSSFLFARIPFILLTGLVPVLTAKLAFEMTGKKDISNIAGWMAVFPIFYVPYLAIPDSFLPLMICGGILTLCLLRIFSGQKTVPFYTWIIIGICCGVINLCRADGLLWIVLITVSVIVWMISKQKAGIRKIVTSLTGLLAGFLGVAGWWYVRNYLLFGQLFSPASQYSLWFTTYDQLFNHPAGTINFQTWVDSGLSAILSARWSAIKMNLATALGIHSGVILLPFIVIGLRKDSHKIINFLLLGMYGILFLIMSLAFPFAGSRGGFFHSAAVFQPWLWVIAAVGFYYTIEWVSPRRKWDPERARRGFGIILIGLLCITALAVYFIQVFGLADRADGQNESASSSQGWDGDYSMYQAVNQFLPNQGMSEDDVVLVNDPPLYYWASSQPSVVIPNGSLEEIYQTAQQFNAHYLVVEPEHVQGLDDLYLGTEPSAPWLDYLGTVNGNQIYRINP